MVQDIQDSVDINQFGNIQGVSTAHYLLNLMDVLFQGADKPKNIGTVVLTDFSKAFDLVNHSVAIQKLIHLGVRGTIVPWICSFLYGRKQCVRYNQTLPDFLPLFAAVRPRHQTWAHSLPGSHQRCCCGWHSPLLEICGRSYVRRKSAFQ